MLELEYVRAKNDDVVRLRGTASEIRVLAGRLLDASFAGTSRFSLNEFCVVSAEHPVKLSEVQYSEGDLAEFEYLWPCHRSTDNYGVVRALQALAEKGAGDRSFQLSRTTAILIVECGKHREIQSGG
jgi:hypothetical protein